MSLSRSDRRKLRVLEEEGYFRCGFRDALMATVIQVARNVEPPCWLPVFLTESNPIPKEEDLMLPTRVEALAHEHVIYEMLGCGDEKARKDGDHNPRVLAAWLKLGLEAPGKTVAAFCDCDPSQSSRVLSKWRHELAMLLGDAAILGITGEDLYFAASIPGFYPARLLTRLQELRLVRNDNVGAPSIEAVHDACTEAWFDFRVAMGLRGKSPDLFSVYPPRWFVKEFVS